MNSTYFLNCVSGNVFNTKADPALPTTYYLGLSTTAPDAEGGNVSEPGSGSGYARVQLTNLSEPTGGKITNSQSISFNESTSSWGVVTHYVIYDALTGGNLLMYGELDPPRTVDPATIMTIKDGYLELSVLNPA